MASRMRLDSLLRLHSVLPAHCAVCRRVGTSLCPACAALLRPAPAARFVAGVDHCVALFAYEGAGRQVIARLKFHNHRDSLRSLSTSLAASVSATVDCPADLVTWIPTTARRRRERGYDQARLIAEVVGSVLGVPVVPLLRRSRLGATGPQAGRGRSARLLLRFEPTWRAAMGVDGAAVVVVDDVRTTGGSLAGAAAALRTVGVRTVIGATLAATP